MWRGVRAEQSPKGVGNLASGGTTLRHHVLVAGAGWIVVGFVIGTDGLSDAVNAPFAIVIALTVVWALAMGVVITRRERLAVDAT